MRKVLPFFAIWLIVYISYADELGKKTQTESEVVVSAQEMYGASKAELDAKRYHKAISLYEVLETKYPYSPYAQQAKIDKAYAYHQDNQPKEALTTIQNFIKQYPTNPHIDYLYYLQGLVYCETHVPFIEGWNKPNRVYQDAQPNLQALKLFKALIAQYPNSSYVPQAQQKIATITLELSEYKLNIARYYMKRGAYIAAINRAKSILEEYPNTPANEHALLIVMKAYKKLGYTLLSEETKKQLQQRYPDSRLLKHTGWF